MLEVPKQICLLLDIVKCVAAEKRVAIISSIVTLRGIDAITQVKNK